MPVTPIHLLIERQHYVTLLQETRVDYLRRKYSAIFDAILDGAPSAVPMKSLTAAVVHATVALRSPSENKGEQITDWIISLDPEPTKKFSQWLLNGFLKGQWLPEDGYKAIGYLRDFQRVKRQMPVEQRDINHYASLHALYDAIEPYLTVQSQRAEDRSLAQRMHAEADVLLDTPRYKIVIPKTQEASCFFGVNTQWCTAAEVANAFNSYNKNGPLYIILDKKQNRRWQYHAVSDDLMDERDHAVIREDFAREHPEIDKFFQQLDGKAYGQFGGGIVFRKHGGPGLLIKTGRGLLGRTLVDVKVTDANQLIDVVAADPTHRSDQLWVRHGKQFAAVLNQFKITGISRPYDGLYFNGRWTTNLAAAGERVIGYKRDFAWYSVAMGTYTFYGLMRQNTIEFVADVGHGEVRFSLAGTSTVPQASWKLVPVDNVPALGKDFGKYAIDLVLRLNLDKWSPSSVIQTRHLPTEEVKRLHDQRPDFPLDLSASLRIDGVTDELKAYVARIVVNRLPSRRAVWVGDRLVVGWSHNLYEKLLSAPASELTKWLRAGVYALYNGFDTAMERLEVDPVVLADIYPHGPQEILANLRQDARLRIGKSIEREAKRVLDGYDPASPKDISQVLDILGRERSVSGHGYREIYRPLIHGLWTGIRDAFETRLIAAIGDHCPDDLYFVNDGRYTKDVDLFRSTALLAPIQELIDKHEREPFYLARNDWDTVLGIKFDLSSLHTGFNVTEFNLPLATEAFLDELML